MNDQRASFTADVVATARAAMSSTYLGRLIDADGHAALPRISQLFVRGLETPAAPLLWRAFERAVGATGYLAGRTLYFDAAIRAAIGSGIDQVVLVGAGFDTRATRLSGNGVAYYEVDHPATQAAKRARLRDEPVAVHRAPADLRTDSLASALENSPFDATRPAFFLWEGVTMYLEPDDIDRTLRSIAEVAAPGSLLALDATSPPERRKDTLASHVRRRLVARAGEPFRFTASVSEITDRMSRHGWTVRDSANAEQLFDTYCAQTPMRPPHRPTNYVLTAARSAD
jgi:methyltransferase (TIGR00027 family)